MSTQQENGIINDELPSIDDIDDEMKNESNFKCIIANARSLNPKIQSLYDNVHELDLSLAIVSETGLQDCKETDRLVVSMREGEGLDAVLKNRSKLRSGGSVKGGGVAIIYNRDRIHMKPYKLKKTNHEIVAALGKIKNVKRRLLVFSIYLTPNARKQSAASFFRYLSDSIHTAKLHLKDPYILIGGDFNRHSVNDFLVQFQDIEEVYSDWTRYGVALDRCFTNLSQICLLYTSPSPRDRQKSRMPSSA